MANPNPSPATRFKPGVSANPGGKTSEQRRLEIEAAEMAAFLRHQMLSSMRDNIAGGAYALAYLTGEALKLFKDSEDRAHGAPKQTQEIGGPDGGPLSFETVALAPLKPSDTDN